MKVLSLDTQKKATCLLTLLSCVLSIFSIAPSNLNSDHVEFSYKGMEHKSGVKSHQAANKQQRVVTEVEHVNRSFQQQVTSQESSFLYL